MDDATGQCLRRQTVNHCGGCGILGFQGIEALGREVEQSRLGRCDHLGGCSTTAVQADLKLEPLAFTTPLIIDEKRPIPIPRGRA